MLHHLGHYADPSSDCAGLSKEPFLRPSSTRTGRGAYVAYGIIASSLTSLRYVRSGAVSEVAVVRFGQGASAPLPIQTQPSLRQNNPTGKIPLNPSGKS